MQDEHQQRLFCILTPSCGEWSLDFTGGAARAVGADRAIDISELLGHTCFGACDGTVAIRAIDGSERVLPASEVRPQLRFADVSCASGTFQLHVFQMPWHAIGCRFWWTTTPLSGLLIGQPQLPANFQSIHWRTWRRRAMSLFAEGVCMRPALDKTGRTRNFSRCLAEPSISTLGLLTVLAFRAGCSRDRKLRDVRRVGGDSFQALAKAIPRSEPR